MRMGMEMELHRNGFSFSLCRCWARRVGGSAYGFQRSITFLVATFANQNKVQERKDANAFLLFSTFLYYILY